MLIQELKVEYEHQQRAFELVEIAEGFALRTRGSYGAYVDQLLGHKRLKGSHKLPQKCWLLLRFASPSHDLKLRHYAEWIARESCRAW